MLSETIHCDILRRNWHELLMAILLPVTHIVIAMKNSAPSEVGHVREMSATQVIMMDAGSANVPAVSGHMIPHVSSQLLLKKSIKMEYGYEGRRFRMNRMTAPILEEMGRRAELLLQRADHLMGKRSVVHLPIVPCRSWVKR